jgi:hypothetical protein
MIKNVAKKHFYMVMVVFTRRRSYGIMKISSMLMIIKIMLMMEIGLGYISNSMVLVLKNK